MAAPNTHNDAAPDGQIAGYARTGSEAAHNALTVGSLFSGIGGIDLGLERAGLDVRWMVERDPYCQGVLRRHWPDIPLYDDITTTDWKDVERVDVVAGGFPCQPFSYAGLRAGVGDDRWLWPAIVACLRALRPRYVLLENVAALLSDADAFGAVLGDLHLLGFDAEWSTLPACAVGAPHTRDRVFVLAYATNRDEPDHLPSDRRCAAGPWQSRGSRRSPGRDWWLSEPPVDRVAHGLPLRVVRDGLHALGNAVVPAVAEAVGHGLLAHAAEVTA